ncbi:hypothetical protein EX30DRAFT_337629 [Ascodesmis nigricans]|uniref:Uncharacterized protein n=1 Tax=Ascodesmis nigricans TaxID=341454 RepID=A0A4S2N7B4_9PEZI|nr:hypothetical protein EX30DRAFT_337629 [Ascodesmis nigricans]
MSTTPTSTPLGAYFPLISQVSRMESLLGTLKMQHSELRKQNEVTVKTGLAMEAKLKAVENGLRIEAEKKAVEDATRRTNVGGEGEEMGAAEPVQTVGGV